jgi:histidinol-phosphate/aromatic aminotransferase/cobyric acid decarboxylase-like protein
VANRRRLEDVLAAIPGFRVVPSAGNFVFVHVPSPIPALVSALCARGVGVRGYPDGIRITVGPWGLMERLIEAVRGVTAA